MKKLSFLFPLLTLAGSSTVVVVLYIARFWHTSSPAYGFLLWNLFLAWLPVFFAFLASRWQRSPLLLLMHSSLWLLFLPNAPYLLTDLIHLGRWDGISPWYDLLMLLLFALTGLLLGFFSLSMMQDLVSERLGVMAGWLFAGTALALSSFGVYLGRFQRWNSWDLLTHPQWLLRDILALLRDPLAHWQPWGFIVLLALTLSFIYFVLEGRRYVDRRRDRRLTI